MEFQMQMYTTYVRPILENNTYVWSPYLLKDIDALEGVQRFFTRQLPEMDGKSYEERMERAALLFLEERRIIFDITLVYKILHGLIDIKSEDFFVRNATSTRGHSYKLGVQFSRVNYRKYFFANRVVNIWNNLPLDVVESPSLYAFKKAVNKLNFKSYCRGHAITTQ